jgi:hypothetical protein
MIGEYHVVLLRIEDDFAQFLITFAGKQEALCWRGSCGLQLFGLEQDLPCVLHNAVLIQVDNLIIDGWKKPLQQI